MQDLKDSSSESRVKDKLNVGRAKEKGKNRAGRKIIRSNGGGGGIRVIHSIGHLYLERKH